MRPSVMYQQKAEDVEKFLLEYRRLISVVPMQDEWFMGNILDTVGDPEILSRIDAVAKAAGRAQSASTDSGMRQSIAGQMFDPLANWENSFVRNHPNRPQLIDTHCQQMIGRYEQLARDARLRENGLAGIVARFARFPTDVREAAGLQSSAGQRGAFIVGIAAQAVATLVAAGILGVIGYAATHLIGS